MTFVDGRRERGGRRVYRATLRCGTVLEFESATFVPALGEAAPCLRHGYCTVSTRSDARPPRPPAIRRAPRRWRTTEDVLRFLAEHPRATPEELRRSGFSLRLIREAMRSAP